MASYVGKVETGGENPSQSPVASTLYGVCNVTAGTQIKYVDIDDYDELLIGTTVHVKFTASNSAESPKLKVGDTDDKPIYIQNISYPGTGAVASWAANSVVSFTYDGTAWRMNDATGPIQTEIAGLKSADTTLQGNIDAEAARAATAEADRELKSLKFTNVSVAVTDFETAGSHSDYPVRGKIVLTGVTADMIPFVAFGYAEADSGDYSTFAETFVDTENEEQGVYIYTTEAPSAAITIPVIICWRA